MTYGDNDERPPYSLPPPQQWETPQQWGASPPAPAVPPPPPGVPPPPPPHNHYETVGGPPNPTGGGIGLKIGLAVAALAACGAAFFGVRQLTGGDSSDSNAMQSSTADDDGLVEDDTASSEPGSAERTVAGGDDMGCVLNNVDDSILPDDVNSLDELYAVTTSDEVSLAYVNADFACHPDPVGSDAYIENLRLNLELGLAVIEVETAEARCLTEYLTDNHPNPARVLTAASEPGDVEALTEAVEACFDADDVAYLNREEGSGPQTYGDHPSFDSLFDDCSDGDNRACDLLWIKSSFESDYSNMAFDCAGRGASPSGFCTPGIEFGSDDYALVDSPGVAQLVQECRDGSATACDLLSSIAPPGSKSESIGFNCGGRVAGTAVPDCRTALADG